MAVRQALVAGRHPGHPFSGAAAPPPKRADSGSAFDILAERCPAEAVPGSRLLEETARLERLALVEDPAPVVLASFGTAGRYVSRAETYANLADRCTLVGVLGTGTTGVPESKVRYTPLDERDPLSREWIVTVVGPTIAEVVAARSLGRDPDAVADDIEFISCSDRDMVMAAAQLLIDRVVPALGRLR